MLKIWHDTATIVEESQRPIMGVASAEIKLIHQDHAIRCTKTTAYTETTITGLFPSLKLADKQFLIFHLYF